MRRFYVKPDNIQVSDENSTYVAIEAATTTELLNNILAHYGWTDTAASMRWELWSRRYARGMRLDTMTEIPAGYEFMYVRGVRLHPPNNSVLTTRDTNREE